MYGGMKTGFYGLHFGVGGIVHNKKVKIYMWQFRVEIEHYSVAYFACIAGFKAL